MFFRFPVPIDTTHLIYHPCYNSLPIHASIFLQSQPAYISQNKLTSKTGKFPKPDPYDVRLGGLQHWTRRCTIGLPGKFAQRTPRRRTDFSSIESSSIHQWLGSVAKQLLFIRTILLQSRCCNLLNVLTVPSSWSLVCFCKICIRIMFGSSLEV